MSANPVIDTDPAAKRRKQVALTLFLALPFFLVSGMLWYAFQNPPTQRPVINARGMAVSASIEDSSKLVPAESIEQGVVLIVEDASGVADDGAPIYLAGTINAWNPADPALRFTRQGDGRWMLKLARPIDGKAIQFRFTRGTRESEEVNDDRSVPPARTLPRVDVSRLKSGEPARIELIVHGWADRK